MNVKTAIVVGAGAWGGWTAYMLQKAGVQTTLLDKAGPGNVLSGSGGQSRVIRMAYGGNRLYTDLTERAFELWSSFGEAWQDEFYHETGSLWLFRGLGPSYAELSIPLMKERGFELSELSLEEAAERFPQVDFNGITSIFFEPKAGYLEASRACQVVKEQFEAIGGNYHQAQVTSIEGASEITSLITDMGDRLSADTYVFACGPWMSKLIPEVAEHIHVSRQEVYYFHPAEGHSKGELPIWIEFRGGEEMYYGIPGDKSDGFKLAYDQRNWSLDPDKDDRGLTIEIHDHMQQVMDERFPAMKGAKLLRHHTCVYESSPDGDFIIDQLPDQTNGWVLGGSSGHGFKMGPAIGEMVSKSIIESQALPEAFSFNRFHQVVAKKTQYQVEG